MESTLQPNSAIPVPLAVPRDLPKLSAAVRSEALSRSFASRSRLFCCSLLFLFLSSVPSGLEWSDSRTIILLFAVVLILRIVPMPEFNVQLQRWGHLASLTVAGLLLFVTFPSVRSGSEWWLDLLLISLVISGSLFLFKRWFLAAAALFGSCYSLVVLRFYSPPEAAALWTRLAVIGLLSALVQRTQAKIAVQYNEVSLTDETRLALYFKAAEEAQKAQRRFERLSNAGKEGLILHSAGKVLDANTAALELLRLTRDRMIGQPVARFLSTSSARLLAQRSDPKNSALVRAKLVREDGAPVEVLAFNHEVIFPDGPLGVLGLRTVENKASEDAPPRWDTEIFRN